MGLRTNKKKNTKLNKISADTPTKATIEPRILVIHRGTVGPIVPKLIQDVKMMLTPHVVQTIQVLRSSRAKDITAATGGLHISHTIIFTRTTLGLYMKLCCMPRGPTITFSISEYSLSKDVLGSTRRQMSIQPSSLAAPPCLMIYNLQPHSGPRHLQLVASTMLQVFSTFTPGKCSSRSIKRCCLLNYDEDTEEMDFRHYVIQLRSAGAAKLVTKLANSKKIPNLQSYDRIEDAFDRAGAASESEGEEDVKMELPHIKEEFKHKPISNVTSIKMKDTGPRITMKLQKVEAGFLGGEVLFNRVQQLSMAEVQERAQLRKQKKKEKLERKRQLEKHVENKKQVAEDHRKRCLEGMPEDQQQKAEENLEKQDTDEEDEGQYYKEAIGEAPDDELALRMRKSKRRADDTEERSAEVAEKKAKRAENRKEEEAAREKAKDRYKMLDDRNKSKKPRSFGKRLAKKLKNKAKTHKLQVAVTKEKNLHEEKGAPKSKK